MYICRREKQRQTISNYNANEGLVEQENDLNKIRKQIDDIDIKILSLLNKRAGLARKTTALKKDIVFDPKEKKNSQNLLVPTQAQ